MSTGSSRKKEKRSRSSSSEANNSFVKNVTSRVSSFLPSTITKWFGSPSTSANGSAPTADATDSSTDDESPESPTTLQPPSKRMRFSARKTFKTYRISESNNIPVNVDTIDASKPYTLVQSTPNPTTFRPEPNFVSTPIRLTTEEVSSDKSEKDISMFKSQHTMSTIGPSVAPKRRSLFDSSSPSETFRNACVNSSNNTIRDPSQPCFKPSLLGSPFYPGRTMYGGASSSYINRPNIRERKKTIVNESMSNENNTMSQSTRRIMDLLENYSSPLSEARRIPHYVRPVKNNNSQDTSTIQNKSLSPNKIQELHVPSIASILRLKQRSRLNDSTAAARLLIASHSSTDYLPYPSSQRDIADKGPSKMPSKIKSRLTKSKRDDDYETELPVPVKLPTGVLQIDKDNLPKFCFGFPPAPSEPARPAAAPAAPKLPTFIETKLVEETKTMKRVETTIRKTDTTKNNLFKFAHPARVSTEQIEPTAALPTFTFGSPERSVDKKGNENNNHSSCIIGSAKENENRTSLTESKKYTSLEKSDYSEVKKPINDIDKPEKCAVCKLADRQKHIDKCHSCEAKNTLPLVAAKESSKWQCQDCWVRNEESAAACVCCGAKNASKASAAPLIVAKPADAGEWKCDDCWVKNKSTASRCVACGGAPPATTAQSQPAAQPAMPPDTAFKAVMKAQSDKWECPNCLVKNDSNKAKCVCCETEKPGTKKDTTKPSFNFGVNTTFKFGIDPKVQQQEVHKTVEANALADTKSKVEESETNNNVVSKIPSFTFGIPAKISEQSETTGVSKTESTASPKLGFSFGIPSSKTETTTTTIPTFGISSSKTDTTTTALPTFKIPSSKTEATATTLPSFGIPSSKTETTTAPLPAFGIPSSKTETATAPLPAFGIPSSKTESKTATLPAFGIPGSKTESAAVLPSFGIPVKVPEPKLQTVVEEKEKLQEVPKVDFANLQSDNSQLAKMFSSPKVPEMPTLNKPEKSDKVLFGSMFSPPEKKNTLSNSFSLHQAEASTSQAVPQMSFSFSATSSAGGVMFAPAAPTAAAPAGTVSLFQKPASGPAPPPLGSTAPVFSFGANPQQTNTAQTEKPKFNFSFGSTNKTESVNMFQNSFGGANDKSSSNKFSMSSANAMTPGNGLPGSSLGGSTGMATSNSMTNSMLSGGLPAGSMGSGMEMQSSPMMGGSMQAVNNTSAPSGGMFGTPVQKENMWSSNSIGSNNIGSNSLFGNNQMSNNNPQKPAAFTFGASSGFNPQSFAPTFGAPTQSTNVFGISNAAQNNQPSMFASGGTQATGMFGSSVSSAAPAPAAAPAMSMFAPAPAAPAFGAPSLTPAQAPAFNFGAPQSTGMFGFGQPPSASPQAAAGGVYSFGAGGVGVGAGAAGGPQVQFAMGSAPSSVAGRRVRRAVRRSTQR